MKRTIRSLALLCAAALGATAPRVGAAVAQDGNPPAPVPPFDPRSPGGKGPSGGNGSGGSDGSGGKSDDGPFGKAPPRTDGVTPAFTDPTTDALRWESWWMWNRETVMRVTERVRRRSAATTVTEGDAQQPTPEEQAALRASQDAIVREIVFNVLMGAVKDKNARVRASAVAALGRIATPPLLPGDPALAEADRQTVTKLLRELAVSDGHPDVRDAAVLALGSAGVEADLVALEALVFSENLELRSRSAATVAFGLVGGRATIPAFTSILRAGRGFNDTLRASAALASGSARCLESSMALLKIVEDKDASSSLRAAAHIALARLGAPEAKDAALAALGAYEPAKSSGGKRLPPVQRLTSVRRADEEAVRRSAVLALGELSRPGDIDILDALCNLMNVERDDLTRRYAIITLGRTGSPEVRDQLLSVLRKGYRDERGWAAIALGILGDASIAPQMREILRKERNDDPSLRGALCIGLGLLGDTAAVPLIREQLAERSKGFLQGHAALGLALAGDPDAPDAILPILVKSRHPDVRRNLALAIGLVTDKGAVDELLRMLKDQRGDDDDRMATAMALGTLRMLRAVPALAGVATNRRAPDGLRAAAVSALGRIAEPEPVPRLARFVQGLDLASGSPVLDVIGEQLWRR